MGIVTGKLKHGLTTSLTKVSTVSRAQAFIEKCQLIDLKRHCISRGMAFELAVESSVLGLQSWFLRHFDNEIDRSLLNKFDEWNNAELTGRKVDPIMLHTCFNLGDSTTDEEGNKTKLKRLKGAFKEKKKRRERTSAGIFSGTKKAYTFQCADEKKTLEDTTELVMGRFKEAKENSIRIWYKKRLKQNKTKK